jgi:hypothetical protein
MGRPRPVPPPPADGYDPWLEAALRALACRSGVAFARLDVRRVDVAPDEPVVDAAACDSWLVADRARER